MNDVKKHIMVNTKYSSIADMVREAVREKMSKDIEIRDMEQRGKGTFYDYDLDEQMIYKHGKWMRVVPNPKKKLSENKVDIVEITNKIKTVIKIQEEVIKKSANIVAVEDKLDHILQLLVNKKDKKVEKNGFRG